MKPKNQSFFNLETTLKYAVNELLAKNFKEVAANSETKLNTETETISLMFLQEPYIIKYSTGEITTKTGEKASIYNSIIILHYLNTADGSPLANNWISFRELSGGHIYSEPFHNRAIIPFIKTFGERPDDFIEAARRIGGVTFAPDKKYSMIIPVLPRVKMNFILYPGDEEFPTSANILLDARANSYLPTEDYAHLPGIIIRKMAEKK